VVFLGVSEQVLGYNTETDHDGFLPCLYISSFTIFVPFEAVRYTMPLG
jgi:hypothetical protein